LKEGSNRFWGKTIFLHTLSSHHKPLTKQGMNWKKNNKHEIQQLTSVWPGVCISWTSLPRFHGPVPCSFVSTSAVELSTCKINMHSCL
jgi:hypothetical protein